MDDALRNVVALLVFALCALLVTPSDAAQFYRFKDKNGITVVRDYLPPEVAQKGYEIVDERGTVVETVAPRLTMQQLQEERERERQLELEQRKRIDEKKRDALLLRQFSTVDQIIRNQNSQLAGIDINIGIQRGRNNLLKVQLKELQRRAADYERRSQPIPETLATNMARTDDQIQGNLGTIAQYESEKQTVRDQYQKDIVRFKELKAQELVRRTELGFGNTGANLSQIFSCNSAAECDKAWQLAQLFAHENASGRLEVVTDTLILSSKPINTSDIGLSLARIPSKNNSMRIVLEIDCVNSEDGEVFCEGDKVGAVRDAFIPYIESKL